jgi:hypothetical protein
MEAQRPREDHPALFAIETKPQPVTWLDTAPRSEPERRSIKFVCLMAGGSLLFATAVGAAYWTQRRQIPAAAVVVSALIPPAQPAPMAAVPPAVPPAPQLAVGLPWLSGPTTGSVAVQSPVPAPTQPSQLVVGLQPIAGEIPPDAPAPVPEMEAPPPDEPLPTPDPQPKPHRRAANPPASPVANPNQSSGVVKY